MLTDLFVPGVAGVRVERAWRVGPVLHLAVAGTRRWARCPLCQRRSKRRHSQYERTLTDLPCAGAHVMLHLRVRRFVCRVRWCRRRTERPGQAAPFAAYLRARWAEGCHNGMQLWRELRERGYTGCYDSVAALVAPWRGEQYRHRGQVKTRRASTAYTPRQVCWLLLRPQDSLTADDEAYLTRLYHACPQVALAEALVEEFGAVLREHDVEGVYLAPARPDERH